MDQYESDDWDKYDINTNPINNDYGQKQFTNYDQLMVEIFKYLKEQSEKLYVDNNGQIDNCLNVMLYYDWSDEILNKSGFYMNDQIKLQLEAQGVINKYSISQKLGECEICLEKVQFYQIGCQHYFCIDCYQQYVISSLKSNNVPLIRCLKHLCNYKLPYQMILLLNHDAKKYYKISLCKSFLQNNMNYVCCLGEECENIHSTQVGNQIDCPSCYTSICIICKQLTHQPLGCDLAQRWAIQNKNSTEKQQDLMKQQYQICYNCQQIVERSSGCNHMICRCGTHFCYICGQKWDGHQKFYQCNQQSQPNQKNQKDLFFKYLGIFKSHEQLIQCQIDKNKEIIKNAEEIINKFTFIKININNIKQLTQSIILYFQTMKYASIYEYYYTIDCQKETKAFRDSQLYSYKYSIDNFKQHLEILGQMLKQIGGIQQQDQLIAAVNQICKFVDNFPNFFYQEQNKRKKFLSTFNQE